MRKKADCVSILGEMLALLRRQISDGILIVSAQAATWILSGTTRFLKKFALQNLTETTFGYSQDSG
jgi:hypothetical protein